jgi:hypothetical protein
MRLFLYEAMVDVDFGSLPNKVQVYPFFSLTMVIDWMILMFGILISIILNEGGAYLIVSCEFFSKEIAYILSFSFM